jgi:hypothetical protein
MTVAAPSRAPAAHRNQTTPIGTGELHQALEASRDLGHLHAFCSAHVCTPGEVSVDGKRLDVLRVLDFMRQRGYQVTGPTKPQEQPRKGFTAWLIDLSLPNGARCRLGFFTPNTS